MGKEDHKTPLLSLRTCIGCRTIRQKKDLQRLVMRPNKEIVWDQEQNQPGRGVYVCNWLCLKKALEKKQLRRAFRQKGKLSLPLGIL